METATWISRRSKLPGFPPPQKGYLSFPTDGCVLLSAFVYLFGDGVFVFSVFETGSCCESQDPPSSSSCHSLPHSIPESFDKMLGLGVTGSFEWPVIVEGQ